MGKDEQGNGRIKKISSERRDAAENRRSPSLERTLRDIEQARTRTDSTYTNLLFCLILLWNVYRPYYGG